MFTNLCTNKGHSNEELKKFYANVEKGLREVKNSEGLIVMGDLHMKVGHGLWCYIVGDHGLGEWNNRGHCLIQFCE